MNQLTVEQQLQSVELRLDKLEAGHSVLATKGEELRVVLGGEQLTGKPGVLQNMQRILNVLFDEKEGAIPRLTAMERRELERMGWVKGAYFMWLILGAIVGALIMKFVFK